ncbi:MAG TPA: recombinase family protein [Bacteroidia bacterium]|nr:recombinase family protein [Bacteroidia bacterium]
MKVAIYCRVSTHEQNTDAQEKILKKYCSQKQWKYVVFTETETTRKTRPVKQEVLRQIRAKVFDAVLIYKLDRWARSTTELLTEIKEITDKGINFISVTDSIDFKSATGQLQLTILAAFTQFERALISERTRAALAAKKQKGIPLGRPPGSKDKRPRRKSGYYIRELSKRIK